MGKSWEYHIEIYEKTWEHHRTIIGHPCGKDGKRIGKKMGKWMKTVSFEASMGNDEIHGLISWD